MGQRPLKVGLYIPNGEGVMGAGTERWRDVLRMGDLEIRIDHVVEAVEGGSLITVTTEISGPGAEGVGPMVTADAPKALAALAAQAESEPVPA